MIYKLNKFYVLYWLERINNILYLTSVINKRFNIHNNSIAFLGLFTKSVYEDLRTIKLASKSTNILCAVVARHYS